MLITAIARTIGAIEPNSGTVLLPEGSLVVGGLVVGGVVGGVDAEAETIT